MTRVATRTLVIRIALCSVALLLAVALLTRHAQAPPRGVGAGSEQEAATAVPEAATGPSSSLRSTSAEPSAQKLEITTQPSISLRGQVLASECGLPLPGATVQACVLDTMRGTTTDLGNTVTTDNEGRFACVLDRAALPYLRVSCSGYAARIVPSVDSRRETVVELDAECDVAFHLVHEGTGEPLSGVACQVQWRDRSVLVTSGWRTTDASGVIHAGCLQASHGGIHVQFEPHGFYEAGIDVGREPRQAIEIVVPGRRDLTVMVVDESGRPIDGARVEIAHNLDYATTTDASGQAVLAAWLRSDEGLPLIVRARGYSLTAYSLAAEAAHGASPARIELATAGTLTGSCASDEECVVNVRSTDPAFARVVWEGSCRAAREWRIDDVQVGQDLLLEARFANGTRVQLVLPPLTPGEAREVELPSDVPACRIAGTMSGGRGPALVRWQTWCKSSSGDLVWAGDGHAPTDPDGAFELSLALGTTVELWGEAGAQLTPRTRIELNQSTETAALAFGPRLEGCVTDQRGLPVARAVVWLRSRDPGCRTLATRTDGKGRFGLDGLVPAARYSVGCSGPDFEGIVDGPSEVTSGAPFVGLVVSRKL